MESLVGKAGLCPDAGAGLALSAADLAAHDVEVVEVIRPNRRTRRLRGKSDAVPAALAALNGEAHAPAE